MLYKPRVFISHSAKESEASTLCEAVDKRLRAAGFDVLWDANLPTSDTWRAAIDEWIWNCDAAVLVLSKDAVVSKYVTYEATLLRQRWLHMKPRFALVPVWCPGVNHRMLVENMGALQIAEIHTNVKLAAWPSPPEEASFIGTAQEIVAALEGICEQAQPRHEIEDCVIKELYYGADDSGLADIANAYQLPPLPDGAKKDRAILLARLLIDSTESLGSARFDRLKNGIPTMMAALESSKDRAPQIVKLVAPFCWVPADCVGRIPALLSQASGDHRQASIIRCGKAVRSCPASNTDPIEQSGGKFAPTDPTTGEDHETLQINAPASAFRLHPRSDRQSLSPSPPRPLLLRSSWSSQCSHGDVARNHAHRCRLKTAQLGPTAFARQ